MPLRYEIITNSAWYGACSRSFVTMAIKVKNSYADVDGNWSWPEKTWFRERLNAIKAREQEQRRKPIIAGQKSTVSAAADGLEKDPQVD